MSAAIKRFFSLFLLAQCLTACAFFASKPIMPLDSAASIVGSRISYLLSFQEAEQQKQMLLVLEHQQHSVQLVGLSNTGITLFILQRNAEGDYLEKTYFYSGKPEATNLLDQLLLTYYRPEFITSSWGVDWQLKTAANKQQWFYRDQLQYTAEITNSNGQQAITLDDNKAILHLQIIATENLH